MSIPGRPFIAPHARKSVFTRFAEHTAKWTGRPTAFISALSLIVIWGITGPLFEFSDTWQLVINTGTTIVTFLMVFLIQNSQNRDTAALHLKLDELLRAIPKANTALIDLEELSDGELDHIRDEYEGLARAARHEMRHGKPKAARTRVKKRKSKANARKVRR